MRWVAMLPVIGLSLPLGCRPSAPEERAPPEPAVAPIAVDGHSQWGDVGCTPSGPELDVAGRWVVDPPPAAVGKPLRGEWLVADDGTRFLVSYAGGRFHPELDGQRVAARGRRCSKEGQSVGASHLALSEIRVAR